jgi:SAM-dependent methyltransferase
MDLQKLSRLYRRYRVGYSVSRMYVDDFLRANELLFRGKVIDVGGTKAFKAGYFDIENFSRDVKYLNSDHSTDPDYLCSAEEIFLPDCTFDTVIFSEVLEHLENPEIALSEIYRILRLEGVLVVTVPFMFKVHGAPNDYQRWTEYKLRKELLTVGFQEVSVEPLGGAFAVLADILKQLIGNLRIRSLQLIVGGLFLPIQYFLVEILDKKLAPKWTLEWPMHYCVVARKREG